MSLARRLDRLHRRYPRRAAATPAFDLSALTSDEVGELDDLLGKLEGAPKRPGGRADLSILCDAEVERLSELSERVTVKERP